MRHFFNGAYLHARLLVAWACEPLPLFLPTSQSDLHSIVMLRAVISLRLNQVPYASLSSVTQWSRLSSHASSRARPLSTLSTLNFSDEVRSALDNKKPLVALESTIISHGMPYPQNYETAIEVEKVVRDNGAIPATIAILDGQIQFGLSHDQIRTLAKLGRRAVKASRRDLAVVMSKVNGSLCLFFFCPTSCKIIWIND